MKERKRRKVDRAGWQGGLWKDEWPGMNRLYGRENSGPARAVICLLKQGFLPLLNKLYVAFF